MLLFLVVPAFLGVGVLWGTIYALWIEAWLPAAWPDWLKGVVFAVVPLSTSLLIVMPLLGLGGFVGVGAAGPVVATGELM